VKLLDPPKTGPVTRNVVRRRGMDPVVALLAFHADVLPAKVAEAAGGAAGGTGGGPADIPPSEEMGGGQGAGLGGRTGTTARQRPQPKS
jgi:hypothetical protein